jgi:hypothetical protein
MARVTTFTFCDGFAAKKVTAAMLSLSSMVMVL